MRQRKKFTDDTISQIRGWVEESVCVEEMARMIGCTIGTLRVRCSQLGIRLPRKKALNEGASKTRPTTNIVTDSRRGQPEASSEPECEQFVIRIPLRTVEQLCQLAQSKGISTEALAAALLEVIVRDDLYDAVLDLSSSQVFAPGTQTADHATTS
jgi:hypothetical protein